MGMTGIKLYPINAPIQRWGISWAVTLLLIFFGAAVSHAQLQNTAASKQEGTEAGADEPQKTEATPDLRALIENSAQLTIDLAAIETQMAEVSDTEQYDRALQRIDQSLGKISQRLETLDEDGASPYRLLNRLQVISELNEEIEKRFRERDIEIPFPQRDLHVRDADVKPLEPLANEQRESEASENEDNSPSRN